MTKHYQAHADRKAKEKYLAQMPNFLGATQPAALPYPEDSERERLLQEIRRLPSDKLKELSAFLETLQA